MLALPGVSLHSSSDCTPTRGSVSRRSCVKELEYWVWGSELTRHKGMALGGFEQK